MKKISYPEIFKQSLEIIWKKKPLCLYGFLIFVSVVSLVFFTKINLIIINPAITLLVLFIVLALFFYLKFLAIAALIKSAMNPSVFLQSPHSAINKESKKYANKLFFMQLTISFLLWIIFTILFSPAMYLLFMNSNVWAGVFFVAGLIFALFIAVLAYYLVKYAQIFIVTADVSIANSLEMAYGLFEKNTKESITMGLLMIIFSLASGFIYILLTFLMLILFLPIFLLIYFLFVKIAIVAMQVIFAGVVTLTLIIFLSCYFAAVQILWVNFFKQISLRNKNELEKEQEQEVSTENLVTPEAI